MKGRKKGPSKVTLPIGQDGLIGAESYEVTSSNGLIRLGIKFGMTRQPTGGAAEVSAAFRDLAEKMHGFAKGLEAAEVVARESGGDA